MILMGDPHQLKPVMDTPLMPEHTEVSSTDEECEAGNGVGSQVRRSPDVAEAIPSHHRQTPLSDRGRAIFRNVAQSMIVCELPSVHLYEVDTEKNDLHPDLDDGLKGRMI